MILTGRDLQWYLDKGLLKISPVKPEQFQQNGIDIYVKTPIVVLPRESVANPYTSNIFYHGHAHLGETEEYFEMPNDLMAFVQIRSSWARKGFIQAPTVVDAGFKGTLTVELFNGGPNFVYNTGEAILHLIFAKLSNPSEPYNGKYQNQSGITFAKV